jgi:hypothetical protein
VGLPLVVGSLLRAQVQIQGKALDKMETPRGHLGVEITWLRGKDLNLRPLGYEDVRHVYAIRKNP